MMIVGLFAAAIRLLSHKLVAFEDVSSFVDSWIGIREALQSAKRSVHSFLQKTRFHKFQVIKENIANILDLPPTQ